MGKIRNFLRSALLAGGITLASLFPSKANAQSMLSEKNIRVIDPIMKLITSDSTQWGLANFPYKFTDNNTGRIDSGFTDSQGRIRITTSVNENNETNIGNLEVRIFGGNSGVNFLNNLKNPKIKISNILGQEINEAANNYWNLKNNNGIKVAGGIYPFMIFDDDELISTGIINYNGRDISYSLNNLVKDDNQNKKSNSFSKENSTRRYALELRDELTPQIGNFNDIVHEVNSVDSLLDVYEMIYNFQINHLYDPNFLTMLKRNVGWSRNLDGDTISVTWLKQNRPCKIFKNRGQAPSPLFNQALDDLIRAIEDSTQISYRGNTIPRQTLFQEVSQYDSNGINMNYSGNLGDTDIEYRPAPPGLVKGAIKNATVKINRNFIVYGSIIRQMGHELGHHALFANLYEPSNPTEREFPLPEYKIYGIILLQGAKDYTNLSLSRAE